MFQFNIEKTSETSLLDSVVLWDLLIIGGGPAGLNAALYAKRKGLSVGVLTSEIGGQLHNTTTVDNYLGYAWIEGKDLSHKFLDHINNLDIPIFKDVHIHKLTHNKSNFELSLSDGKKVVSKTVIMATGGAPKQLGVPGEFEFVNKGVSYCTTCDAPFFKDKHVVVAGGGNSAAEAVLDLVPWARKITVVHRSQWRADQIILENLANVGNLTIHLDTQITSIVGDSKMTGIQVLNKKSNESYTIEADGIFVEIGTVPKSTLVKDWIHTNERGEIIVDANQMTSLPGLFAAGDVTNQPYKQIIISAAEGAKAALAVTQYLNHQYKGE